LGGGGGAAEPRGTPLGGAAPKGTFLGSVTSAAAATVAAHDNTPAFAGDFAAVRGDIAAARGDHAGARREYERAIAAGTSLPQLIRLKLDNLPAAG
jgi:predicted negative regulator of RcsB-dependent stress response